MAAVIGVWLGLVAGYVGGVVEVAIMRLVDLQMALPGLLLLLIIINAVGPSVTVLILVLGFSAWMLFARVVRAETLALMQSPFIEGARASGATGSRIVLHHVAPNVFPTALTLIVLDIGPLILAEAGLSFLGLGIQPPDVAWGLMVAQGRDVVSIAWWVMFFPGLAITLTVLSLSLTAVWLRTVIDPLHRRTVGFADVKEVKHGPGGV
jgi:peptide/nickel transport system permease protein